MKQTREKELLRASEAVLPEGSEHGRQQENENSSNVLRTYKARLFAMIFSNKEELLKLYNAVNQTNYKDPELLTVNTLENAIYMSMQNDISFLIAFQLNLYEHQSTYSPNLPLRYLMYVSDLYSVITKNENLYGRRKVKVPTPRFLIFYNGVEERPDMEILRLSDLYEVQEEEYWLDLKAVMLNINPGHNQELLDACPTLKEYSEYTSRVRRYAKKETLEAAVERAITECIQEGILEEFLRTYRAEVKSVSIYEYDEERHMRQEREEAHEEGREEGRREGEERMNRLILALDRSGRIQESVRAATDPEYLQKLFREFGI